MPIIVGLESLTTKSRFVTNVYRDKNGNGVMVGSENSMPTIDVNHLRLHEGRAYYAYKFYNNAAKLSSTSSIDIAIAWPDGVEAHSLVTYECGGSAEVYVYESPTTNGGTPLSIHRRNRVNTTASQAAAVLDPTITDLGAEFYAEFIASGQGGTGSGGTGYTFEFVLKPLTTYLFRLTNVSAQSQTAELRIDWYE
jgi:hypothetical protein